jgi:hypothetical protein
MGILFMIMFARMCVVLFVSFVFIVRSFGSLCMVMARLFVMLDLLFVFVMPMRLHLTQRDSFAGIEHLHLWVG